MNLGCKGISNNGTVNLIAIIHKIIISKILRYTLKLWEAETNYNMDSHYCNIWFIVNFYCVLLKKKLF